MGVDYSCNVMVGFLFYEDNFNCFLDSDDHLFYKDKKYDGYWSLIDAVCDDIGVNYVSGGNAYNCDFHVVIGPPYNDDRFETMDFEEVAKVKNECMVIREKLLNLGLEVVDKPRIFAVGMVS